MTWDDAQHAIRVGIRSGSTAVLKCDGIGRRLVTSHTSDKIGMRTGLTTAQSKAITYEMLRHAFETLERKGRFASADFREKFEAEYRAAPCRFSMTGGVLVEAGLANLVAAHGETECHYVRARR